MCVNNTKRDEDVSLSDVMCPGKRGNNLLASRCRLEACTEME